MAGGKNFFIDYARWQEKWIAVKVRARGYPDNKIALAARKGRLEPLFALTNRLLKLLQYRYEDSLLIPHESHGIIVLRLSGQFIRTPTSPWDYTPSSR